MLRFFAVSARITGEDCPTHCPSQEPRMKNYILGAAVLALAAACGGGSKPTLIAAPIDAIPTCNPIAQSGCKTGEKCTWIVDVDANPTTMAEEIGHIGCVAVD